MEQVPRNRHEQQQVDRLLRKRESLLQREKQETAGRLEVLEELTATVLGLPFEEFHPLLASFFEELTGALARRVFEQPALEIHRQRDGQIPEARALIEVARESRPGPLPEVQRVAYPRKLFERLLSRGRQSANGESVKDDLLLRRVLEAAVHETQIRRIEKRTLGGFDLDRHSLGEHPIGGSGEHPWEGKPVEAPRPSVGF
jgi:hypothetical protein